MTAATHTRQTLERDDVLADLRRMIADGSLPPGGRLPPERELAEQMRVNRRILRAALAVLAEEGSISRQVGRGTFVGRAAFGPFDAAVEDQVTPMELMEARLAIEPVIAGEAALRARQGDLRRLSLYLKRGEEAASFDVFEDWDSALHRAIAEATQNVAFVHISDMFVRMRASGEWTRLKRISLSQELKTVYRRQHRQIVDAIGERDPKSAAQAMRDHLTLVRERLSQPTPWAGD